MSSNTSIHSTASSTPVPRLAPPAVATSCPDLLDALANGWFIRQWMQEIVVPASYFTAPSGAGSSSRKRKLAAEALSMSQTEQSKEGPPAQEAPEQENSPHDVQVIAGEEGVFNTETGPVAVVLYPHLTSLLSSMGLAWVTDNTAINIDTTIDNLSPDVQRALQHAAMSANDIIAPAPPVFRVQNEKFTERMVGYTQQLMGHTLRVLKNTCLTLSMTASMIPAHIPDVLIWFGDSLRGLVEVKKGSGHGLFDPFVKWWNARLRRAARTFGATRSEPIPEEDLYDVCALSELPGSAHQGPQNLFGKILQSARSVPRQPGSSNDVFLLLIHDFTTFIPAIVAPLSSTPPRLPLPSLYELAKAAWKNGLLGTEPQDEFAPPRGYEPYLLVIGKQAPLNSRFPSVGISYPLVLSCGARPSTDFLPALVPLLGKRGSLVTELGLRGAPTATGRFTRPATSPSSFGAGLFGFTPSSSTGGGRGISGPSRRATTDAREDAGVDDLPLDDAPSTPPSTPPSKGPSSTYDSPADHPAWQEPDPSTAKDEGNSSALTAFASRPRIGIAVSSASGPVRQRPFRRLAVDELREIITGSCTDDLAPPMRLPIPTLSLIVEPSPSEAGQHSYVHFGRLAEPDCDVGIAFKASTNEDDETDVCLANEGLLYEKYGSSLEDVLPRFVGAYIGSWNNLLSLVLIVQRHGRGFEEWSALTPVQRTDTMTCLEKLHAVGIKHCDVKPWNVLYDDATGKIKLVDLSRAEEHECPGSECDELVKARSLLALL
ncbi:hypothetical protein Rt10032_c22g6629 [Rhodotorula toruloides]|uniref:Protein kinase domain-containing protein n=1 Tax=Rhodotorula toruloides TaxID=5286 RepID=A0A511KQG4_RHOTO|nr:hypothetical protein Rt10032_c22g6629 [Rhodotorula toruloides]